MVDDAIQPCRPARPGRENIVPEPFSENPPPTMRYLANKPPRDHAEAYLLCLHRANPRPVCRIGYGFGLISPRTMGTRPRRLRTRTAKIIELDESLTLSITNPLGTSDEIRIPARMALIPPLENRKLGRQNHQM